MQPRLLIAIAVFLLSLPTTLLAQANSNENDVWIWMGGANSTNQSDNYGIQGVPSTSNLPGARQNASTWVDSSGNFWLFGGLAAQPNSIGVSSSPKNDLWEFNPTNGAWTWVSGSAFSGTFQFPLSGVYGSQGVPANTNTPGARSAAMTWTDKNGNLWLFGGSGFDSVGTLGDLNDLWEFKPASAVWTWVSGSNIANQQGIYGIQGVSDLANMPGARAAAAKWIDGDGNLWLFGGAVPPYNADLNDLWEFNPSSNLWTWVSGFNTPNQFPQPGGPNVPGPRAEMTSWVDAKGNFWFFGGVTGTGACAPVCGGTTWNDLWEFNPKTSTWSWITGSYLPGQPGVYGIQGVPAASNSPGSRTGSVGWTDKAGNLWLFGGAGQDAVNPQGGGTYLNDLWMFNPGTGLWTWMAGSNIGGATGNFGNLGIPASSNVPGGKAYSSSWIDGGGNLWLFGGQGWDPHPVYAYNGLFNDLWRYQLGIAPIISGPLPPPNGLGGAIGGNAGSTSAFSSPNNTSVQIPYAEPISTGNGNYYYQHTDLAMPGRGLPLTFQRNYNALDNYAGPLGANWTHSLNIILTQTAAGVANIRWGDGHGETFTLTGATYVPQVGVFSTFVANADGTYALTQKTQTKFNFSAAGKLASVQDKNGNAVLLSYDSNGNLVQITDTVGRKLSLSYDTNNRITHVADPIGRIVSYAYDGNNNLASVTDPASGITQYAYDGSHHVTTIVQPSSTTLLQNIYDAQGRVTSQTNGRGFTWQFAYNTPSAGITTITDPKGNKTFHTYDSSLRIVQITDPLGDSTSYAYDANNDRVSVTNANGKTSTFAYDDLGNITNVTNPLGNTVQMSYDALNDLLSLTNPKGNTTTFAYDSHGNLTSATDALGHSSSIAYDSFGEPTASTNANGNTTTFTYDSNGDLTKIVNPLSQSTALAYDGVGRLVSITDANGHTATVTYDALNRLTKSADPLGNATELAYDAVSNLLKRTDANNHATGYAYDAVNNLVSVTDAKGNLTKYAYDGNNNRTAFTNAIGKVTSYTYDAANRLVSATDPLSFVTSYSYDAVGNVVAVTDAKAQTNHFTYDALNRLSAIAYADGKTVAYVYDADGDRISMTDAHGATSYAYNLLDQLTSVTNPGRKVVSYTYDAMGNRTGLTYPDGKLLSYGYDAANRLSQVTDWLARATNYSYDATGNPTKTSYPNGAGMGFNYDAANRLAQVVNTEKGIPPLTLTYSLDPVGNRTTISVNGLRTNFAYDALNELVTAQLGSLAPIKTTWTYDAAGNRILQASVLGTTKYTYDSADRLLAAGTRTFIYDANGNQTSVTDTSTLQTRTFTYDAANRMTAATGPKNSSFAYDGDGNRITQLVGSGTYNYVNDIGAGLPVALQESGPDGNITYAYGLGLIEEAAPAFNYFYQYDGLGNVIGLTDAKGALQGAYAYDAWGNTLLSATDVGTRNKFRYTGEALDPGTGLYFLRARYYDPSSGTFLSRDPSPGFVAQPQARNRYRYSLGNPIRYTDPSGLSAIENTNQTASVTNACGTNCEQIWSAIFDAVTSGAAVIAQSLLEGWNSVTSIGGVDAGNTAVQTGAAIVINPDTVSAETNTIQSQPALIQSAAGFLGANYSRSDLDGSFGLVCANSYAGGVCLRGEQYVEGLIMKDAAQQGHLPGFQQ